MEHLSHKSITLSTDGFCFLNKADYCQLLDFYSLYPSAINEFVDSFNNLPIDEYMNDGGKYRFRRFGRLSYNSQADTLSKLPHEAFFQSRMHNSLNGNMNRDFSPMEDQVLENKFLHFLIKYHYSKISNISKVNHWKIYLHQIRIVANNEYGGNPAPEGIHRDGHYFVAQILISKNNVSGGVSQLYNQNKDEIFKTELTEFLDSILLDDRRLYHNVSPIQPKEMITGNRDMLLIDFNPMSD